MKEINTTESHETTNGSNGKTIAWTLAAIFISKFVEPFLSDLYHEGKECFKEWKKKRKDAKKLEELKELRPWDYYTPKIKSTTDERLQVSPKIPLWGLAIYEGKNYNLFAPTNVGKTTLALQILNELAYADTSSLIAGMEIGKGRRLMFFDEEYNLDNFSEDYKNFYKEKSKEHGGGRIEFYGKTGDVEAFLDRLYSLLKDDKRPTAVFIDNISALCGQSVQKQLRLLNGVKKIEDYLRDCMQPSRVVTAIFIGHTNLQNYADRYKPITERDMQGSSELGNMITGSIAMGYTHLGPGYYRLLFPKNKVMQKTDKVHIIRRADAINFEYICEMNEEDAISKNASLPTDMLSTQCQKSLVDPEILKRAKLLSKENETAKAERERLKAALEKECRYANMDDNEKDEIRARVRELKKAGYKDRLTSCIILLEMNVYISADGVSKIL